MRIPTPRVGDVVAHAYLWRHEHAAGLREGVKNRPVMVVLATATDDGGRTVVTVAPITHSPPDDPGGAVEIWPRTKDRLGLDGERSWIVVDDLNVFTWPGYDLRPVPGRPDTCLYGALPAALVREVQSAILKRYRALIRSDRDE
jgi:hypothetical protein